MGGALGGWLRGFWSVAVAGGPELAVEIGVTAEKLGSRCGEEALLLSEPRVEGELCEAKSQEGAPSRRRGDSRAERVPRSGERINHGRRSRGPLRAPSALLRNLPCESYAFFGASTFALAGLLRLRNLTETAFGGH